MCRLLGYLGSPRLLGELIADPPHSLVVQSYQPREMTAGLLNADGFGLAWYDRARSEVPFLYRSILPIWSDINLPHLNRYVLAQCFIGSIRSATPGQPVDLSNCPPFTHGRFSVIHNGFVENFRTSLYRPLRSLLQDEFYHLVHGSTDSEHIFALLMQLHQQGLTLQAALRQTLHILLELSCQYAVRSALNLIITDGETLIATRCASASPVPSLYWRESADSIIVASEPLWDDREWQRLEDNSILVATGFGRNLPGETPCVQQLPF